MNINEIINLLRNEKSINKKKEILENNKNNEFFKKILKYTYDPNIIFGIKNIKEEMLDNNVNKYNEERLKKNINKIYHFFIKREIRGNKAKKILIEILNESSIEERNIILNILNKDLKCGINKKLINNVFPNLIYEIKYMGAVTYDPKKVEKLLNNNKYIIAQEKMDGEYMQTFISKNGIITESRNGKPTFMGKVFKEIWNLKNIKNNTEPVFLMGELIIENVDRYTSNGIINSLKTLLKKEAENKNIDKDIKKFEKEYGKLEYILNNLKYVVWDMLTEEEYFNKKDIPVMNERLKRLETFLKQNNHFNGKVELVNTKYLSTKEEIYKMYYDIRTKGGEGIIIKAPNVKFKQGKPSNIIKFKPEFTIDLKITGVEYGNKGTKYEKYINKIYVESSDGIIKARISGMNEAAMEKLTNLYKQNKLIGKIVEVKATELSKNKNNEYSLLHPSFEKIRYDKSTADNFNSIKENSKMVFIAKKIIEENNLNL